jgi:hypothetical protein
MESATTMKSFMLILFLKNAFVMDQKTWPRSILMRLRASSV